MAKKLMNPIEVRATYHYEDGLLHYDHSSILYGLACDEHGIEQNKTLLLELTDNIGQYTSDFVDEALSQAEAFEDI